MSAARDPLDKAREFADTDRPAESPDERSVPHYLQSIALSLADIAESLRIIRWPTEGGDR